MIPIKAPPIFFEGTKLVRASDLPSPQSGLFAIWARTVNSPSSLRDGDMFRYEDYEYWYQNHYLTGQNLDNMI